MNNKILIVDNEDLIRKRYRSILEHAGYEVIEAEDGKQAICNRTQRPARGLYLPFSTELSVLT